MTRKTAKYVFIGIGLALVVYAGSKILVPDMIVPSPFALEITNDRIKSYAAVLKREQTVSGGALRCSERIRKAYPIEDQWGTLLRCNEQSGSIVIQSAGADKIFDSKDDVLKEVDSK